MQSHNGFCGRKAPCFLRSERTTCCVLTTLLYHCLYLVFSISNGLTTPRVGRFSLHRLADLIFLLLSFYLKKKKIWSRVRCQHSEKRSKTHKRLKERFLIKRNRTKRANFQCNHLFRATYNTTENSDANLFLAVRCQEAGGMKARKRWLRQKFACFVLFHLIKKCSFNLFCVLDLFILVWRW